MRGLPWHREESSLVKDTEMLDLAAIGYRSLVRAMVSERELAGEIDCRVIEAALARHGRNRLRKALDACVQEGVFELNGTSVVVPRWAEDQPTGDEISDPVARQRRAIRSALLKKKTLCLAIRDRDRECCRYCGVRVRFEDHKGPEGGTYDHCDPFVTDERKANTMANVVVACRQCNGQKERRTPVEWERAGGRALRPAPGPDFVPVAPENRIPIEPESDALVRARDPRPRIESVSDRGVPSRVVQRGSTDHPVGKETHA